MDSEGTCEPFQYHATHLEKGQKLGLCPYRPLSFVIGHRWEESFVGTKPWDDSLAFLPPSSPVGIPRSHSCLHGASSWNPEQ